MASQVLSGASNPSYTNNTGQNVRVVVNYMGGTPFVPARFETRTAFNNTTFQVEVAPVVPSTITINWAGVSVSNSSNTGNIAIGRNLAVSQLFRDTAMGGTQFVRVADLRPGQPGYVDDGPRFANQVFEPVGVNNSVALAAIANNASGPGGVSLPTELMLAPGQTFSAVCGVHNIIVIPEAG